MVLKKPEKPGEKPRPISTREGVGDTLESLLDGSVVRADAQYNQTRKERIERGEDVPELTPEERRPIAEAVGIGAVKYADLSQNRTTDYVFNWDKMLAMDGNTGTYMQYAYARIQSIFRKGEVDVASLRERPPSPSLEKAEERALALELLRLEEALATAAVEYKPNALTTHLWDLAKAYNGFYQVCSVLRAETPEVKQSRLLLCDLTARSIKLCLQLLGIETVEQM